MTWLVWLADGSSDDFTKGGIVASQGYACCLGAGAHRGSWKPTSQKRDRGHPVLGASGSTKRGLERIWLKVLGPLSGGPLRGFGEGKH
jgi:hypothetical protein